MLGYIEKGFILTRNFEKKHCLTEATETNKSFADKKYVIFLMKSQKFQRHFFKCQEIVNFYFLFSNVAIRKLDKGNLRSMVAKKCL